VAFTGLPTLDGGGTSFEGELSVRPSPQPLAMSDVQRAKEERSGSHFHVTMAAVQVTGVLRRVASGGEVRVIEFDGAGTYKHRFGTEPLHAG
jgi:hypothetical protein